MSLPDMFDRRSDLLRILAIWEWRRGSEPRAGMHARELPRI
jgi:hypothetical protein